MTTTTDKIMTGCTMSTVDGMKRCIAALEAHARELEKVQSQEKPCVHEWYQGECIHCEIKAVEFRKFSRLTKNTLDSEHY